MQVARIGFATHTKPPRNSRGRAADCSAARPKIPGDDRLSRLTHYHGPRMLNGRVRDGNGCGHPGVLTGSLSCTKKAAARGVTSARARGPGAKAPGRGVNAVKRSAVSTGQLRPLLALHPRPIDLVVFQEPSPREGPETSSRGGFHA